MAAHFAWGPRTESGTEIWTLASWEPRVTSAEEPEWCGGVMTGSFSKSTGGGGDRLGSIEPHLCFCPSNTPISTIFTGQCWPFFSLLWNSLKNYIPRKHTLSPHISEVNVLKCKGGRKTIGTTGNRREFLKKKIKSSYLSAQNLLQLKEMWRISDEHYSGASHPITKKLWSDVRRNNWRANMYESPLTGLHICNDCLIQAKRK